LYAGPRENWTASGGLPLESRRMSLFVEIQSKEKIGGSFCMDSILLGGSGEQKRKDKGA